MFYKKAEIKQDLQIGYLGKRYTIKAGFKYKPSIPIFYLNFKGITKKRAYEIALIHDFVYQYRIGTWWEADKWLFKQIKLNLLERIIFRTFSCMWWINGR